MAHVTGTPIAYREAPEDDAPGPVRWLNALVRAGALETQTADLEHLLGHRATTLEQAVATLLANAA